MTRLRKYIDRKNTAARVDRDTRYPVTVKSVDTGEVRTLPIVGR